MRICCAILCACAGWPFVAGAEDLTTLTGQTYSDIVVQRYDWEGIFIKHGGGLSKIPYAEIPAEMRDHYKKMAPAPAAEEKSAPPPPVDVGPSDLLTRSGTVYRNVTLRQTVADSVRITHDGGVAIIPFADLPEDLQTQLRARPRSAPETPPGTNDLVTTDGEIFRNVQVRRIEPDGLTIHHDTGLTKVELARLSEEMQKKYEYDFSKAEAYRRATAASKDQLERDQQAIRKQNEAARQKQIKTEPIRVFHVVADEPTHREYRVRFSVRNNDIKPQTIQAHLTSPLRIIKTFTIPAETTRDQLEVVTRYGKPTHLKVTCGLYTTTQALNW